MDQNIKTLQQWIDESQRIVFFRRRRRQHGIGHPRFPQRGWAVQPVLRLSPGDHPQPLLLCQNPEEFYRFYREKMLIRGAKPNPAHLKLAELEQAGKLTAVVTQNIDGLHQAAGSQTVYELHGSTLRNYCMKCKTKYPVDFLWDTTGVPRCPVCGGIVRPDVVLYEEGLDADVLSGAIHAIQQADMLIIGGTSLVVYPAAGLINYYNGHKLVLINKSATGMDSRADLAIHAPIGEVFSQITVD